MRGRLRDIALTVSVLLVAGVAAVATPTAAVAATNATCGYGTGGYQAGTLCWLDMSNYVEAQAHGAGQAMSVSLPGGYTASFTVLSTAAPGRTTYSPVAPHVFPTWGGAYMGNKGYVNTPGKPALYMTNTNAAGTQVTLSNITVTDSAGNPVTGYGFVMADAESTDTGESLNFSADVPLSQIAAPAAPTPCAGGLSGLGTTRVLCKGNNSSGSSALIVQGTAPNTVTAAMYGNGLQGEAFAIVTSKVELSKNVVGRVNPSDSFDLTASSPEGTRIGSATTGTGNTADTGPITVLPRSTGSYTLKESATAGTQTVLGNYSPSWSCTNNGSPYPVSPSADGSSAQVSPGVGDFIACTITNTAKTTSLSVTKHAGTPTDVNGDGLVDAGDTIDYTFTVSNTGQLPLSGVTVNDAKIGPVSCPQTTLAPGTSQTCTAPTYTITADDVAAGAVRNTATASGNPPGSTTPINSPPSSTSTATTAPVTGLTVSKTASPTTVTSAGQKVGYSFTVTNTGNVTVNGLSIADTFTAPAGPVPAISCPTTTLAPSASTTCTATYTATQKDLDHGSVRNTATASGKAPDGSAVTSPPDTATVTATQAPNLSIVKSASPSTVTAAGQRIDYAFAASNTGNVTLTNLSITDTFAAPAGPAPTVRCPVTTLAPGTSTTCATSYTVTQADIDSGAVSNTATGRGTAPDGSSTTSPPSSASVTASQAGSLTLVKAATPTTVTAAGQMIAYTFTATNTGTVTLTALSVVDSTATPAGPSPEVSCPSGTLVPGQSVRCSASYTITQADIDNGTIADTATATSTAPDGSTITSNPSALSVPVRQAPALVTVKTASPATISAPGQQITYRIQVTNTGNVTVSGITVADQMAAPAGAASPVSCPLSTLAPGVSTTCTATYTASQADVDNGSISNTATATGHDPNNQSVTSPGSTATVSATRALALTLTKTATPTTVTAAGQQISYSFAVTNTSNVTLTGLSIADTMTAPAGPTPTVTCPTSTLAPGASTTCTATYTATQADVDHGRIVNTATATGSAGGVPISSPPSTATVTAPAAPALTVVKSAAPATVSAAGEPINYSFEVTNTGNVTVASLTVHDAMAAPAGPTPTVTCPTSTLAPGASTTCTATYTVTEDDLDGGSISNTATVSAVPPAGGTLTSDPSMATVGVSGTPALALTKSSDPASVTAVGQSVTYTFVAHNIGNQTITNLTVTDAYTSPAADPAATVTCPTSTLVAGASTTCTATHTVTQADLDNGQLANTATATGTDPRGVPLSSLPASTTVAVAGIPQLALVKSADPTTVTAAGQTIAYTFAVTNTGNLTVTDLAVGDTFAAPAGPGTAVTCPVTTLAPGASTTCTSSYTVTQADIDAGAVSNTASTSATDPQGNPVPATASSASVNASETPSLTLVKSADPQNVTHAGDLVTYQFLVSNSGNVTMSNLAVADTMTAPAGPASPVVCPVTTLAPGAETTCSATYTASQADLDSGSISNTASVTGTDPSNVASTSTPSTATVAANPAPALAITKTPTPAQVSAAGQTINYSFTVDNTGNVTLHDVAIADSYDSPASSGTAPSCPTGDLTPGAVITCTSTYTATQADIDHGRIVNTAFGYATDPHGNPAASAPVTATVTVPQNPTLLVVKAAAVGDVQHAGDIVDYTFTATNTGNVTLSGLSITDTLAPPAGPTPNIDCPLTTLLPATVIVCTARYTVTQADIDHGRIDNSAVATASTAAGTTITSDPSTARVDAPPSPALSVVKSADPTSVAAAGQTITYAITVRNTGNVTITDLAVTDTVTSPATATGPTVFCPNTTLAPGDTVTCTATDTVTLAELDNGRIADTASATGTTPDGAAVPPAIGSTTVSAAQQPDLAVVKTADPAVVTTAGQRITYSFAVTNTGNVTISDLAIDDTLAAPAGPALTPTCPVTTLAPTDQTTCAATYTVTQADIDAGTISNTATADGAGPGGDAISSQPSTATVTVLPARLLHLAKHATATDVDHDGHIGLGDTITWTFAVTNIGTVTIRTLTIADPTASTVTCPTSTLAPGTATTCTSGPHVVTQTDVDHGSVNNTAVATGFDPTGVEIASNPSSTHTPLTATGAVSLVKHGTLTGTTIVWTFTVTNTGALTLHTIAVDDPEAAPVTCPAGTLPPGDTVTCRALHPYRPTTAEQATGKATNTATATGLSPDGASITSQSAAATVLLPAHSAPPGTTPPGTPPPGQPPTGTSGAGQGSLAGTGVNALEPTIWWGFALLSAGLLLTVVASRRRRGGRQ